MDLWHLDPTRSSLEAIASGVDRRPSPGPAWRVIATRARVEDVATYLVCRQSRAVHGGTLDARSNAHDAPNGLSLGFSAGMRRRQRRSDFVVQGGLTTMPCLETTRRKTAVGLVCWGSVQAQCTMHLRIFADAKRTTETMPVSLVHRNEDAPSTSKSQVGTKLRTKSFSSPLQHQKHAY